MLHEEQTYQRFTLAMLIFPQKHWEFQGWQLQFPRCYEPPNNKKLVAQGTSPCSAGGEKADLDLISKTRSTQWLYGKALQLMETINSSRSRHSSSFSRIRFTHIQLDINQMYNWHKCFVQTEMTVHVPLYKRKRKQNRSASDSFTFIFMYNSWMIYHFSNDKLSSFLNHKSHPASLSRCRCQNTVVQRN